MTTQKEQELEKEIAELELKFKQTLNKETNMWQKHFHNKYSILQAELKGIRETKAQALADVKELIKEDIMLFEDARDILIELKRQGIGTDDCEKLFEERVIQLKAKLQSPQVNSNELPKTLELEDTIQAKLEQKA